MGSMLAGLLPVLFAVQAQGASVTGTIRDADTGRPLPGAVVRLADAGLAAVADTSRRYMLPGAPAGPQHRPEKGPPRPGTCGSEERILFRAGVHEPLRRPVPRVVPLPRPRPDANRVEVRADSLDLVFAIPASAPRVEIVAGARRIFPKEGDRMEPPARPDSQDRWVLPLGVTGPG